MLKYSSILRKQVAMRRMLIASVPPAIGAVYFFGWRSLVSLLVCCFVAVFVEYLFTRKDNKPATEAALVTAVLFALVLPPHTPWHVQIIGISFAIIFSKMVFGGFGKNFFNPALAGRCFVYVSFPVALTAKWPPSAPLPWTGDGSWGALTMWTTATGPDAYTGATPMALMKAGEEIPSTFSLFFGGISGSVGVTSAMLILIGGLYLFYKKTASRTTILSIVITYAILNQILASTNVVNMNHALTALLGGGFLFGAFYMATDPVSSPRTNTGKIYYGIIIATCTTVIRNFSIFNGGLMFSILLGNMFAPIIDYGVKAYGARKKARLESAGGPK